MEKFTAAQARELMIADGAEEIVKFILQDVAIRAESSKFNGAKPSHILGQFALLNFFDSNEWARS